MRHAFGRTRTRLRPWAAAVAFAAGVLLATPAVASADTLKVSSSNFAAVEGQPLSGIQVATFVDSPGDDVASDYVATIDWGDGGVSAGTVSGSGSGPWQVTGSHTYLEEGTYAVTVTVQDTAAAIVAASQNVEMVADAPLSALTGTPVRFSGTGASGVAASLVSFASATGGTNNGVVPGEQNGGYRDITWDGIATDGSDPGSTVIVPGHVVAISPNRLQPYGVGLPHAVAVANDGFASVNPSAAGPPALFPAFSSPNVFAPFNTNTVTFQVVDPSGTASATAPAQTRGIGITFLNVIAPDTTIEYFNQAALIGTVRVPVGGHGQPSFAGLLFPSAVVTRVVVTFGDAAIFGFDGTTVTPGPADSITTNLVAGDDVLVAEPAPISTPIIVTAGQPLSGVIDTFSDQDPNGTVSDYRATIDWGDGGRDAGTISARTGGGFNVSGSHAYDKTGNYTLGVSIYDFGSPSPRLDNLSVQVNPRPSRLSVQCSRTSVGMSGSCSVSASDAGPAATPLTPRGSVAFAPAGTGIAFLSGGQCQLRPTRKAGVARCKAHFIPTTYPPRTEKVVVSFAGDLAHAASAAKVRVQVGPQTCIAGRVPRRLRSSATALRMTVTCGLRARGRAVVTALIARRGSRAGGRLELGHVRFSVAQGQVERVTVQLIKRAMKSLRAAAAAGQRISLAVTITAGPKGGSVRSTSGSGRLRLS